MNSVPAEPIKQSPSLREDAALLVCTGERDRAAFARLLHDDLAQNLTVAGIELSLWKTELEQGAPVDAAAVRAKIDLLSDLIAGSAASARGLSTALRPRTLDSFGLVAALEAKMSRYQKQTGNACRVQRGAGDLDPSPDVSIQIVRIVDSLLDSENAANWTCVSVTIGARKSGVELVISTVGGTPALAPEAVARVNVFGGNWKVSQGRLVIWMPNHPAPVS